jgi:alpha-1,2-mannosyltransferase
VPGMQVPLPDQSVAVSPPAGQARPGRRDLVAAGATLAVSVGLYLVLRWFTEPSLIDLRVYLGAANAVGDGSFLYDFAHPVSNLHFTYPPFAALVLLPLTTLPFPVAATAVVAGSIALLVVALRFTLALPPLDRLVERSGGRRRAWQLALLGGAAGLWLEPVITTLRYGQSNLVILAVVLADLSRPDRSRWKGVGIGLVAGFKLTPGIFAVYLLLTGRIRAALVSGGVFLATVALGWLLLPQESRLYWGGTLADGTRVGRIENAANQSVRGGLARALHTADVETLAMVLSALVAVLGMVLAVRLGRRGDEVRAVLACAFTGLLISPVSWSHHWVWAVPLLFALGVEAVARHRVGALVAVLAGFLVFASESIWWVPHRDHAEFHLAPGQQLLALAYPLVAAVVLGFWARQEIAARSADREASRGKGPGQALLPETMSPTGTSSVR